MDDDDDWCEKYLSRKQELSDAQKDQETRQALANERWFYYGGLVGLILGVAFLVIVALYLG